VNAMHGWTAGQLSVPLIALLWLIILSLRVRTLSRRVETREPAARLSDQPPRHKVTVAELLYLHDPTRRHRSTAREPSSPETTEPSTSGNASLLGPARPRQRVDPSRRPSKSDH